MVTTVCGFSTPWVVLAVLNVSTRKDCARTQPRRQWCDQECSTGEASTASNRSRCQLQSTKQATKRELRSWRPDRDRDFEILRDGIRFNAVIVRTAAGHGQGMGTGIDGHERPIGGCPEGQEDAAKTACRCISNSVSSHRAAP